MMGVIIDMPYERDCSENVMNRLYNPRTKRPTRGLRRKAKMWRDNLIDQISPHRDQYDLDVVVSIQVIGDGKVRGDSANFVKLTADAVATGLGLPSDHRFTVHALPRTKHDGPAVVRIILSNATDS